MIFSFFYALYVLLVTFLCGIWVKYIFTRAFGDKYISPKSPVSIFLLGLIGVTFFVEVTAQFVPISVNVHLFFFTVLGLISIWNYKLIRKEVVFRWRQVRRYYLFSLAAAGILAIAICYSAKLPTIYDTGGYHITLVKWLNEFGYAKGIANLDPTFGFIAATFEITALFEMGVYNGVSYHYMNSVVFIIGALLLIEMLFDFRKKLVQPGSFLIIPYIAYLYYQKKIVANITPDMLVTILIFYVVYRALKIMGREKINSVDIAVLLTISAFSVLLKLSAAPVVLLGLVVLLWYYRQSGAGWKHSVSIAFPSAVLAVPYLLKNYILTGYIVYPITKLKIWAPDWIVPEEEVNFLIFHINQFSQNMEYKIDGMVTGFDWIIPWFWIHIDPNMYRAEMIQLLLLPLTLICLGFALYKASKENAFQYGAVWGVVFLGMLYWFFSGPNPRFASGWIFTTGFLPISLILFQYIKNDLRWHRWIYVGLIVVLIPLAGIFAIESGIKGRIFGSEHYLLTTIYQPDQPDYKKVELLGDGYINVPKKGSATWSIPLPSQGYPQYIFGYVKENLSWRGSDLEDGLKTYNPNLSKRKVDSLYNDLQSKAEIEP